MDADDAVNDDRRRHAARPLWSPHDVSPDGQRSLVVKDAPAPDAAPPRLVVIQHVDALLQRLVLAP